MSIVAHVVKKPGKVYDNVSRWAHSVFTGLKNDIFDMITFLLFINIL